jgi:hypothetical protein
VWEPGVGQKHGEGAAEKVPVSEDKTGQLFLSQCNCLSSIPNAPQVSKGHMAQGGCESALEAYLQRNEFSLSPQNK